MNIISAPTENERMVTGMAKTITGVDYEGGEVVGVTISGIIDADNDQPTSAYFQRVRHGRWEKKSGLYSCSECGMTCPYDVQADVIEYWSCNYCPNCGARMDGGVDHA